MRRRFKLIVLASVGVATMALPLIVGWVTPLTPPPPPAWRQVHVGMHRPNILALVGPAKSGMYPEKIIETWYQEGTLGIRKLEVVYNNPGDDRAIIVREYIYWRPSERCIYTRKEP